MKSMLVMLIIGAAAPAFADTSNVVGNCTPAIVKAELAKTLSKSMGSLSYSELRFAEDFSYSQPANGQDPEHVALLVTAKQTINAGGKKTTSNVVIVAEVEVASCSAEGQLSDVITLVK